MQDQRQTYFQGLKAISTVDGREVPFTHDLTNYLSEGALHRYRAIIEIENLISLSTSELPNKPSVSAQEKETLRNLVTLENFDATAVADYDHFGRNGVGPFEHDVKSVEVYLREKLQEAGLERLNEFLHFPMTSEDVNNLAWNLMIRDAVNNVWLPKLLEFSNKLAETSKKHAHTPVLGKTHGMNASPTTFGKRFAYTLEQITNIIQQLQDLKLTGKFSGPVGNHNAMQAVVPNFDMTAYTKQFVESFGFVYSENANQRNSHLAITRILNEINLLNSFASDFCENIRHSVMMGWLSQVGEKSHVGSSVMPHKINPWFFEVAQGYFEQSEALIDRARSGLLQSVFERDLTDHPWERAYGEMIGKSLVGLSYITDGMDTLIINAEFTLEELKKTPEVVTEAVQIAGRLAGADNIYMKIKAASRGKKLDQAALLEIIQQEIPEGELKETVKQITPDKYTGTAAQIALNTVEKYQKTTKNLTSLFDNRQKFQAVLFDFDNTLQVGDKEELQARLEGVSKKLNLGFTPEEIQKIGQKSDYREMRKEMVDTNNLRNPDNQITEEQFQETNKSISGQFDEKFKLAPGATELLQYLKDNNYTVGLVTTRGSISLPRLLKMHKLENYFDVVINRDDVHERKPHPQPIQTALDKLGVDGTQAIYIGDKPEDVIAGKAVGAKTVLVHGESSYAIHPDHHFQSLHQLTALLSR